MRKLTDNARTVSEAKLKELKADAVRTLAETRRAMMQRQPFTGSVAMNLDIVPIRDLRCDTACTDGKSIFFDIDFLSGLNPEERLFVLAHEVWHNLMCHFARTENRDRGLMNIATDLEVNQILVKDGFCLPSLALMPDKFDLPPDLAAEQYYELLVQQGQQSQSDQQGQNGKSGSAGGQFDKHVYSNDDLTQPGQGQSKEEAKAKLGGQDVSDKYGKVEFDPDFRPGDPKAGVERVREAAVGAAQMVERTRGSLPAHIKGLVEALLKPEIDWREQLQQFVTRTCSGENRNWNPPNRRHVHSGIYLQSRKGEKIRVGVVLDTSGSVQSMIKKFLSELTGLITSFGKYSLHLVQCDAKVQDYKEYTEDDPLDVENTGFEAMGGGGTVLMPGINYFVENELDVDCIIVFTDTYCEDMLEENAPAVPVLWMSTVKGDHSNIHFGDIVEFNETSK